MAAAHRREVDVVLVYRFDRFARSVRHLVSALDEFDALGVEFISYGESFDTTTPVGRAMFSIVAALAELERSILVERSVEGQRRARARGKHVGRPRRQVHEQRVVLLREGGLSLRAIARKTGVSRTVVTRVIREHASVRRLESQNFRAGVRVRLTHGGAGRGCPSVKGGF